MRSGSAFTVDPGKKGVDRGIHHLIDRLPDGCEVVGGPGRNRHIVIADDAHVIRHPKAQFEP